MWFKKKSQISGFYPNTAVDGTDWRTNGGEDSWMSVSRTLPSAADAGNYFYLPTLGNYYYGQLNYVGVLGRYWSSSAYPWSNGYVYGMDFGSGHVSVDYHLDRRFGNRVGGFE